MGTKQFGWPQRPDDATVITTYEDLDRYLHAFGQGLLNLLLVVGATGLQKTRNALAAAGPDVALISGHTTAWGLYREAWFARDRNLIIDDVDALERDPAAVRLLKGICQTETVKEVMWNSASSIVGAAIPRKFQTRSKICIIANDWTTVSPHVRALEDRGHMVSFEPTPLEVHLRTAEWFWDQEIFDFVAERLHLLANPSMRTYTKAAEAKAAGLDWKKEVLSRCLSGPSLLAAELKADPGYATEEERARAFTARGGGCRATYFKYAKAIAQPAAEPPRITLNRTLPPSLGRSPATLDLVSYLVARHGTVGEG